MSVITGFIEVRCDGPDDSSGCPDDAAWMDGGPASRLRARMRDDDGWAVAIPGGIDRCSRCKASAATARQPSVGGS